MARIKAMLSFVLALTLLFSSVPMSLSAETTAASDFTIPAGTFDDAEAIASAFKYQTENGYAPTFENGAVTLKRANDTTAQNNKAGVITHISTLPAGDYVWQFELTMAADGALSDGTYKTACNFGVYNANAATDRLFYYGKKGIPLSARYIDLDNIDVDAEKNNQRAYCENIWENFGTPYFSYKGATADAVKKHYYVLVDFSLSEETEIALSITAASTGYTVTVDNFHLFGANDDAALKSLEYFFAVNDKNNFSLSADAYNPDNESGKYQALKYENAYSKGILGINAELTDSTLYPQPIYSSRNSFYRLTVGNLYKISFKYKCTDLAESGIPSKTTYPITVYPTCGYKKDAYNTIASNESTTLRLLLNGFDKQNSLENKACLVISEESNEWRDAEIEFWAYNANGTDTLDLELTELLSLSVSGKGTLYIDEIEVTDLGNPLETETTVNAGTVVADGNYYFAPYGALTQNGEACEKNADGSFTVASGTLSKKLYPKTENGLSVYSVKSVERGDETLFFNTKPGMIFSVYVENYSASAEYGVLAIRNASEAVLKKIGDTEKNAMLNAFIDDNLSGWQSYTLASGETVSYSVIKNTRSTKVGDNYYQFDVKIYGDLDRSTEKNGVPYKDMKVSVSAYKISEAVTDFSEGFKSAAYSGNTFSEVTYSTEAVTDAHTGTGGLLPLYWQMGDDSGKWYTYTSEQLEAAVQQLKGLNASIVRCYGFQPGYAWDKDSKTWNWDTEYMHAFYEYAKTMYENGIEIIINTTTGVVSGSQCGEPKIERDMNNTEAEVYAEFVTEFVKNVVNGKGIPEKYADYKEYLSGVKYFMYATEPNNGDNTEDENYNPADSERLKAYKTVLEATHTALTEAGLRDAVKLVGPNTVDSSTDARTVKWAVENLNDYIDVYSAHTSYSRVDDMTEDNYSHWASFNAKCQSILSENNINKPFWYDEYNIFMNKAYGDYEASFDNAVRGTQLAVAQVATMQSGASSTLLWALLDFKWTNSYKSTSAGFDKGFFKFGLAPSVLETGAENAYVYAPYYAYSLLGTAIKNGDTVYAGTVTDGGIYTLLLKHSNGKYSVVAVNNSPEAASLKINLPSGAEGTYTAVTYNPYADKATDYGTNNSTTLTASSVLKTAIGAYSVTVLNAK